jgi:hypothetical protein
MEIGIKELQKFCISCGKRIPDYNIIKERFQTVPKHCERCRKSIKGEPPTTTKVLVEHSNVRIVSFYAIPTGYNSDTPKTHYKFIFGGTTFGLISPRANWDNKFAIYISMGLNFKELKDIENLKDVPVKISVMRKVIETTPNTKYYDYMVIENGSNVGSIRYLYYREDVFKNSQNYIGNSYSHKHIIHSDHITILQAKTWSNSGVSGNICSLLLSGDNPLDEYLQKIETKGDPHGTQQK